MTSIRPDDVLLNKASIIERCICRMLEEYAVCPELDSYTHLDALILNIQRAYQAAIDMTMHLIAENRYGIPQSSAHAFSLPADHHVISQELTKMMQAMVGFRNIAVHNYQEIDQAVLVFVVEKGYLDLIDFCRQLGISINQQSFAQIRGK